MAGFCTKCGSGLIEGNNFCTKCGASIPGTATSAAAPVTSAAPSSPPAYAAPTSPAASATPAAYAAPAAVSPKGASGLKIVLIVVGVFVGLGILAGSVVMYGIWRVSRNVNVSRSGQVSINTPDGKISMGPGAQVSEADLGLPIYPGATRQEGTFQVSTAEGSMSTYLFKTSDSPAQVMAFYHSKLDPKTAFFESQDGGIITSEANAKVGFMITVGRDNNGPTTISILRGTSKKAQ